MMNRKFFLAAVAALAAIVSCSKPEIPTPKEINRPVIESAPYITATLPGTPETKLAFEFPNWVLKASWVPGDQVSVVPGGFAYFAAGLYTLPEGGGHSADFQLTYSIGGTFDFYTVFYPGGTIKSYADFTKFGMDGQVQSKSDPMAHLADYFAMYQDVEDYTSVDFSSAGMSACMRVEVSGMTFKNPTKLSVSLVGGSQFYTSCWPTQDSWYYYPGDSQNSADYPADQPTTSDTISVDLDGYGEESSIVAWIAMSNLDVTISAGNKLRVKVVCEDGTYYKDYTVGSDTVLEGGHCHSLTINSGWKTSGADYTEYPFDGEVVALQEANLGLDLVIMGDGFIAEDFDGGDNSLYMNIMKNAAEQFFDAEPYRYLRQFFNVYVVKAVSPQRTEAQTTGANGAINSDNETKFSVQFTPYSTSVTGDHAKVREYAAKAISDNKRFRNMTVIVLANQECRSGTCANFWSTNTGLDYAYSHAIAYFGLGTSVEEGNQLVRHETAGHGFGKLADEYYYNSQNLTNTSQWNTLADQQADGLFKNVDKFVSQNIYNQLIAQGNNSYELTTKSNVLWSDLFGTANNYEETEGLGVYEGGNVYATGFCRPTYDGDMSIMNRNTGIFNAVCRRLILHRANCLMGASPGLYGSSAELEWFLEWDRTYFLPHLNEYLSASAPMKVRDNCVEPYVMPLAPPVNYYGHWVDKRFIEDVK